MWGRGVEARRAAVSHSECGSSEDGGGGGLRRSRNRASLQTWYLNAHV